jgi:ABC-type phosphate transport system substrate-binding protein
MLSLNRRLLAGACVAAAASAALPAAAYNPGDVFSGGASLPAPDFRVRADCYAEPTPLIIKGSPPIFQSLAPFNYVNGKYSQDCSSQHVVTNSTIYYVSATSGTGILAQFSHDPTLYGNIDANQTQYLPSVQFSLSETPLNGSDVTIWDYGGTEVQGSSSVTVVSQGTTPQSGQYPNPYQYYGQVVQFPISIDPVVIAYDPAYKKVLNNDNTVTSYHFNVKFPRSDDSGGLHLDAATYCKIFNGQITNWNDPALKKLNHNTSLEDPSDPTPKKQWSVPLQIVGRGDSAGATSIFTRNLAAVCSSVSGNQYADSSTTLPSSLRGVSYSSQNGNYPPVTGEAVGKFTLATGMPAVAKYVAFTAVPGGNNPSTITQGRMAYLSPDYVLPGVIATDENSYNLNTATLQNAARRWVAPTPTSAKAAFAPIQPPQSDASGHYSPGNTSNGLRTNPQDWVQAASKTASLANPIGAGAYPMVGTANFIGYTCYNSKNQWKTIVGLLKYGNTAKINTDWKTGILSTSGIAVLPAQWLTAIDETFVTNSSGTGININTAGAPGACSAAGVTGG